MSLPVITIGDETGKTCTVLRGAVVVPINGSATVRAAIVTADKKQLMSAPVTLVNTDPGNDWANGVVRVVIPAASQYTTETESDSIKNIESGAAKLEIEINDTSQSPGNQLNSWHDSVMIEDAAIN